MSRKSQPRKTPIAAAVAAAVAPEASAPVETPRAHKDITIDTDATQLVRQFIVEQLNALPPSQRLVMTNTFQQFMNRCVVLAPEPQPDAPK